MFTEFSLDTIQGIFSKGFENTRDSIKINRGTVSNIRYANDTIILLDLLISLPKLMVESGKCNTYYSICLNVYLL